MSQKHAAFDFHSHFVPKEFTLVTAENPDPAWRARWEGINRLMQDEEALLAGIRSGDLAGRVVNSSAAFLADDPGKLPADVFRQLNDALAALVARHPAHLLGLASVDTFGGKEAAWELRRAVLEKGLHGLFLDSARGDRLPDDPETRPLLREAADLGVPVFLHPNFPDHAPGRPSGYGQVGTLVGRGGTSAHALVALIEGGVLAELPGLKIVVTGLAIGAVQLLSAFGSAESRATLRRQVWADTIGLDAGLAEAAASALGRDHILAGSDWPILNTGAVTSRLVTGLTAAGWSEAELAGVLSGNLRRLFGARAEALAA